MGRYSPAPVPTTDLSNTQRFLREELEQVRNSTDDIYTLANFILDNFVVSGYGSVKRTSDTPLADIDNDYVTIPWELPGILTPRGMSYNIPNGISVEHAGVWNMGLIFNLEFDDANSGRVLRLRLRNTTDSYSSNPVNYYVGRNQNGIAITVAVISSAADDTALSLTALPVSKDLEVQVKSIEGDAFTNVVVKHGVWSLNYVSQHGGNYEDIGITQR